MEIIITDLVKVVDITFAMVIIITILCQLVLSYKDLKFKNKKQ
jgi:hypothetical protein